ncbi:MAG: transcription-repair coupling factor [Candidatus Theseobacter exili]|nr:transcription-repair coupling factor [Candidatus Theseobacter exili]
MSEFSRLAEKAAISKSIWISGLWDSSKAAFLSLFFQKIKSSLLVITQGSREFDDLSEDLRFFNGSDVLTFPSWETLPQEKVPPHIDIVGERFSTLSKLCLKPKNSRYIVLTTVEALMHKILSLKSFQKNLMPIAVQAELSRDTIIKTLVDWGYQRVPSTEGKGEFSVRGFLLDIFLPNCDQPIRIEFFSDQVESIRWFDPATQRSSGSVEKIFIIPCIEMELLEKSEQSLDGLMDYLDKDCRIIFIEPAEVIKKSSEVELNIKAENNEYFFSSEELFKHQLRNPHIYISDLPGNIDDIAKKDELRANISRISAFQSEVLPEIRFPRGNEAALFFLTSSFTKADKVYLVCSNEGEKTRFIEILNEKEKQHWINEKLFLVEGNLTSGFIILENRIVVVTNHEIFRRYRTRRPKRKYEAGIPIRNFTELVPGDFVVHINHGIGKYIQLRKFEEDEKQGEYLEIEYQDKARLYVPVDQINLLEKYIAFRSTPPSLNKLGASSWSRSKAKAEKVLMDLAANLLETQAQRESTEGYACTKDTEWQKEFESEFIYSETQDQIQATIEIKKDLESKKPMDRLVCGDAGYGKTEVAMRAAFKIVMEEKQAALLVPTTVLAQQHFYTFKERMADYPINIQMISRFRTKGEQSAILKEVKAGKVDILIGTHRLLQSDVHFKNLGLVIIDEEQRFGVIHKEKLKQMKKLVDLLTLSATPIPRTLYLAMLEARDISLITTPPEDRLPVETILGPFDWDIIRNAIVRETSRNGQIFSLHNRIASIKPVADRIRNSVPGIIVAVAHGQMHEHELEEIMKKFVAGSIQVLVCTTIVQSGLDIPNANTIIIDRAERFGLAELYQLRGRVGRYNRRAYAYLLYNPLQSLLPAAKKRLKSIEDFSDLGSGFKIALRDLEIRGAGNLIGRQQHGHIATIGFDLYCRLLQQSVNKIKGIPVEAELDVTIHLGISPYIDDIYIPEEPIKMELYRKLSAAKSLDQIHEIHLETEDRFGPVPDHFEWLFTVSEIKLLAAAIGITSIESSKERIILRRFRETIHVDREIIPLSNGNTQILLNMIKKLLQQID